MLPKIVKEAQPSHRKAPAYGQSLPPSPGRSSIVFSPIKHFELRQHNLQAAVTYIALASYNLA